MRRSKTGGGAGTNQYKIRDRSQPSRGLDAPLFATQRSRCHSIWGGVCLVWVFPPTYRHASHPRYRQLIKTAESAKTSTAVLGAAAFDPHRTVKQAVARHLNTAAPVLRWLSNGADPVTASILALNPNTPPDLLAELASNDHFSVRGSVAENPQCPFEILEQLAQDSEPTVRLAVATNPQCPPKALAYLVSDPYGLVRHAAIIHPNLPDYIKAIALLGESP